MFLDKRLRNAISKEFFLTEMIYKGVFKDLFGNFLVIFTNGCGRFIAAYRVHNEKYKLYNVFFDSFAKVYIRSNSFEIGLYIENGNTFLRGEDLIEFDGIAFDFLDELILARLEEGNCKHF